MAKKYWSTPRHWVKIGNNYELLLEVDGHVYTASYIIYDDLNLTNEVIEVNKRIREANLIERIENELDIRVKFNDEL